MSDSVTVVTHKGWLQRIGESIIGILFGVVFYFAGFPLLIWNEGRTVKTHLDLEEGKHAVVEAPSDRVDPQFEGKLVHLIGPTNTTETLRDLYGVEVNAIKLRRIAEMYQWEESKQTKTHKKVGGGETTETTYSYHKVWSSKRINSSSFHSPGLHSNPGGFPMSSDTLVASKVNCGAFTLTRSLIDQVNNYEAFPVAESEKIKLPEGFRFEGNGYYYGKDSNIPQIGDTRVSYEVVKPGTASIISGQSGDSFKPFKLSSGREQEMLTVGEHTAEAMYVAAERMNTLIAWLVRGGGLLVMWLGLSMAGAPLAVILDVLPFLGTITRWGIGAMAFVVAFVSASLTIAAAWLFYHPLVSVIVIAVMIGVVFVVKMLYSNRAKSAEVNALFTPPPPPPPPAPAAG